MTTTFEAIIKSWKKKEYAPLYWLEGEEDYYIDQVMTYAEKQILTEAEQSFNLSIFYGKDADWTSVINTCRKYPMFSEKQVVLLKEAQMMNSMDKLEPYFEDPLNSTIFIVAYKGKTLDKRSKLHKKLEKKTQVFLSSKIKDDKIFEWVQQYVKSKGLQISFKAAILIQEHIGNDLSRIVNEMEKLIVNLDGKKEIDEQDIEQYIGISKEYNAFELQAALAYKKADEVLKIINYFEANPKAGQIHMIIPAVYSFFSKVYAAFSIPNPSEYTLKSHFYFNPVATSQGMAAMKNYGWNGVEKAVILMHEYNLKSIGVGSSNTDSASLLREMVAKMMLN
jgi:DNA polymerase-3 subunit delta